MQIRILQPVPLVYVMRQRIEKANERRKSWSLKNDIARRPMKYCSFIRAAILKWQYLWKLEMATNLNKLLPMKCISHVCIAASKYFTGNQRMIAISTVISDVSQLKIIQYWLNEVKPINWPCHLQLFQPSKLIEMYATSNMFLSLFF